VTRKHTHLEFTHAILVNAFNVIPSLLFCTLPPESYTQLDLDMFHSLVSLHLTCSSFSTFCCHLTSHVRRSQHLLTPNISRSSFSTFLFTAANLLNAMSSNGGVAHLTHSLHTSAPSTTTTTTMTTKTERAVSAAAAAAARMRTAVASAVCLLT
jgi:hypothetical protein